jgi:hypothetical protein
MGCIYTDTCSTVLAAEVDLKLVSKIDKNLPGTLPGMLPAIGMFMYCDLGKHA